MTRRIAVLTGKRGGYGAMKMLLRGIRDDPRCELALIATDQHLSERFGRTIAEIEAEFEIAAGVDMEQADGSGAERAKALGRCMTKMTDVLQDLSPDILVLYGDRGEVLSTAIVALNLAIPMAHLQGGDISGNIDESMRHAITKLAHLHFPSNQASADRLLRLGEEPWRVHMVGDNHVDPIVAGAFTGEARLREAFGLEPGDAPVIVLQHPETTRPRDNFRDMMDTLEAVAATDRRVIVVYPCSDQGCDDVIRAIHAHETNRNFSIHKNIDAPDFHGLMAIASVMVGNSSAGLIETPYFPIPAINLGERQLGRLHAENVIDAPFGLESVRESLSIALENRDFQDKVACCSRPFGDGESWRRILDVLAEVPLDGALIEKRMTY